MQQLQSQEPFGFRDVLRNLHRKEIGIGSRVFLSILATSFIAGSTLLCLWWNEVCSGSVYIRDSEIWRAVLIALLPWLIFLTLIWRGFLGLKKVPRRLIGVTIGIFVATTAVCFGLDEFMGCRDTAYALTGLWLIGLSCAACAWFAELMRQRVGKSITDEEDYVRVFCPKCGYSLIGLRECRCPECGEEFTLDEIIRRQDYGATVQKMPPLSSSYDVA